MRYSRRDLDEGLLRGVASVVRDHLARIAEALSRHGERLDRLEATTQRTLADSYQGVWQADVTYQRGELVTHSGSLWLVLAETRARPGTSDAMRLIVKGGRGVKP
jgi:hypothetical protein